MKAAELKEGETYAIGTRSDLGRSWGTIRQGVYVGGGLYYAFYDKDKGERVRLPQAEAKKVLPQWTTPDKGVLIQFEGREDPVMLAPAKVLMPWAEYVPILEEKSRRSKLKEAREQEIRAFLLEKGLITEEDRWGYLKVGTPDDETNTFPDSTVTLNFDKLKEILS